LVSNGTTTLVKIVFVVAGLRFIAVDDKRVVCYKIKFRNHLLYLKTEFMVCYEMHNRAIAHTLQNTGLGYANSP